ncbi:DUF4307 domain-containing protein [Curtobacterium sp. 9128]|uniref:DUF4307 domain-containing protein n=1 Tax=Curtobacterium sp. 9128 TaxID=1793722 RepID=UPI001642DB8E|nr:DUF4307 domain-containing protein [Curtobacterium sp. 9128]
MAHGTRELPWDQDNHPGSPELSEQLNPTPTGATATATLDDRYGRTPGRKRRARLLAVAAAAAIVVVFGAWVIWAGPGQTSHGLDTEDVGYEIVSEHHAVVHSQVSVDPGTRTECTVQVLDKSYTIVGWKTVTLPPVPERTRTITTDVNTTTRGVTGLIHTCWVP